MRTYEFEGKNKEMEMYLKNILFKTIKDKIDKKAISDIVLFLLGIGFPLTRSIEFKMFREVI